jgi:TetR/AcrR family transcriptional repressor of nem operon
MSTKNASPTPSRGRPRAFDPQHVTRRAMEVFWSNGYNGTSLPALLEATELSRSSLYAAYGDKHGLFLQALDQFIDDSYARIDGDLAPTRPAMEGLRACLAGTVLRSSGASGKRGCMVVATAKELGAHDPEVARRVRRFFDGFEKRLVAALVRARAEKTLAEGVNPADAARILLSVIEGLRVMGKTGIDDKAWLATIDALLARFRK